MVKVLILSGDGVNCENDMRNAYEKAGAQVFICTVNSILKYPKKIHEYKILVLPGGFSFGDEIKSGKVLAEKIKKKLYHEILKFIKSKKLILGICNGFQVLMQLGIFDDISNKRNITLTVNDHEKFINKWVKCKVARSSSKDPWFRNIQDDLYMPIRHKEGRIIQQDKINLKQIVLKYNSNVNGSFLNIAALRDKTGQVLGIMPHPEAAIDKKLHPFDIGADTNSNNVNRIFLNSVEYFKTESNYENLN